MKRALIVYILLCPGIIFSQDFSFSQFYEMPLLRNPALGGIFNGDLRVTSVYRDQWGSISVPFQTRGLGVEYKRPIGDMSNSYYTLGLQITHDKAGDLALRRTQILPVLTYHQALSNDNDTYLSGSFMLGKVQGNFDPTKARMDDQFVNGSYSPSNVSMQTFNTTGASYTDMSAGLVFSSNYGEDSRFYVGAALYHLNTPKTGFLTNGTGQSKGAKFVFNAGLSTPVSEQSQIIAYVDFYRQGGHRQVFGGMLYETAVRSYMDEADNINLSVGVFYRWNDAVIPTIRLQAYRLMFGLSYDINMSQLRTASQLRGGLELTLSFQGFFNSNSSTRNKVRCPRFGRGEKIGWWYTK